MNPFEKEVEAVKKQVTADTRDALQGKHRYKAQGIVCAKSKLYCGDLTPRNKQ